jgi:hypothetical protein
MGDKAQTHLQKQLSGILGYLRLGGGVLARRSGIRAVAAVNNVCHDTKGST